MPDHPRVLALVVATLIGRGPSVEADPSAVASSGCVTAGMLITANGGRGSFGVHGDGTDVRGELQFRWNGGEFHAQVITELAFSPDRRQAWFAGIDDDGRRFLAYVEDNGEPGRDDFFDLQVDGVRLTGNGRLKRGNVQIHDRCPREAPRCENRTPCRASTVTRLVRLLRAAAGACS